MAIGRCITALLRFRPAPRRIPRRYVYALRTASSVLLAFILTVSPVLPSIDPVRVWGVLSSRAAELTWTGAGRDSFWATPENWSEGRVPSSNDIAVFDGTIGKSVIINEDVGVAGIHIRNDYGGTLDVRSGKTVRVGAEGFVMESGTFLGAATPVEILGDLIIAGGIFRSTSNTLSLAGDMEVTDGTFVHNSGTVVFNGIVQKIQGSVIFANLEKVATGSSEALLFPAGDMVIVENNLKLLGPERIQAALEIGSTERGTKTMLSVDGEAHMTRVLARDIMNTGSASVSCIECWSLGNVSGWDIPETADASLFQELTFFDSILGRITGSDDEDSVDEPSVPREQVPSRAFRVEAVEGEKPSPDFAADEPVVFVIEENEHGIPERLKSVEARVEEVVLESVEQEADGSYPESADDEEVPPVGGGVLPDVRQLFNLDFLSILFARDARAQELSLEDTVPLQDDEQGEEIESFEDRVQEDVDDIEPFVRKESIIRAELLDFTGNPVPDSIPEVAIAKTGELTIHVPAPESSFRPGAYTLRVVTDGDVTVEQDFTWGVLAMNFDKSSYEPGEEVHIGMGVLDDTGRTLCGANLTLEIYPGWEQPIVNPSEECGPITVTNVPDYNAVFVPNDPGEYTVRVTAETENGVRTMERAFEVIADAAFVSHRYAPTRIYPPSDYPVKVTITARDDFTGTVFERVPDGFDVIDISGSGEVVEREASVSSMPERVGGDVVLPDEEESLSEEGSVLEEESMDEDPVESEEEVLESEDVVEEDVEEITEEETVVSQEKVPAEDNNELHEQDEYEESGNETNEIEEDITYFEGRYIVWKDVVLGAGESVTLEYAFNAPNVSPQFYLLGPLSVEDQESTVVWEEPRAWQVAADAIVTWDGGGTTNNWSEGANWSTGSAPGTGDVATFNATSTKNVTVDANIDIAGIDIQSGYTGIITQSASVTITIGASHFSQADGTFVGGDSAISVSGDFTLSNGSFTSTSGTLYSKRNFTISGGTFTHNSGTLTMDGNVAVNRILDASGVTFNVVAINWEFYSNSNPTLTIASGTTVPLGATPTLSLENTRSNRIAELVNNGTITISSTGLLETQASQITNNGTITASDVTSWTNTGNFSNAGTATFTSSDSFSFNYSKSNAPGSLTNGATGTFTTAENPSITIAGSLTMDAASTAPTVLGGITFNGASGTQSVDASNITSWGDFAKTAASTLTLSSDMTVGAVTFSGGTISNPASARTMTASGDISLTSSGTFGGANLTLSLEGGSTQNITHTAGTFSSLFKVNKSAESAILQTAFTVTTQPCTVTAGTFDVGGNNFTCGGAFTVSENGTLRLQGNETISTPTLEVGSTVEYSGSDSYSGLVVGYEYSNLIFNGSGTWALASPLTVNVDLTIQSGTLDLAGNNPTVSGTLTVSDTLQLHGDETITATTTTRNSGHTITFTGNGDGLVNTYTITTHWTTYENLILNATDGDSDTFALGDSISISGSFTDTAGTLDGGVHTATFDASSGTHTITGGTGSFYNVVFNDGAGGATWQLAGNMTVGNNLTITSGTLDASNDNGTTSYNIIISGDWTNNGTFTPREGTVQLAGGDQTISGTTTFYNLKKQNSEENGESETLTFTAEETTTVNGTLTLVGLSHNDRIILRSSDEGTQWNIHAEQPGTEVVQLIDIQDSNNTSEGDLTACEAIDSGNNTAWDLYGACAVAGTVYADEGATPLGGKTVRIALDGTDHGTTATSNAETGAWEIADVQIREGEIVTVYLDGETEKGVTVTETDGINLTGVQVFTDHLVVRHDNPPPEPVGIGGGELTIADLAVGIVSGETDITDVYDVSGSILTLKDGKHLYIPEHHAFAPGGQMRLGGSLKNEGTFNPESNQVMFTGTGDEEIRSGGAAFGGNVFINDGLLGYWRFDDGSGGAASDSSGYGKSGVLTNMDTETAWTTDTPDTNFTNGYALSFDGVDDYVELGGVASGIRTLSFWMNAGDGTSRKVLDMNGTAYVELDAGGNVVATGFPGATVYVDGTAASAVTENEWHHVAIVDATGVTASSVDIGRVSSDYFLGMLDDVRMYDRALPAGEVSGLAAGNQPENPSAGSYTLSDSLDVEGTFTLAGGGLDAKSGGDHAVTVGGSWLNYGGAFMPRAGTVTMNSTSVGNFIQTGARAFNNLAIDGVGGVFTLRDDLYARDQVIQTDGTVNTSGNNWNLYVGNWDKTGGTFLVNESDIVFDNTSNRTIRLSDWLNDVHIGSPLKHGLVGHWTFDEGTGSTAGDSSTGGNDGTLEGGPTWVGGAPTLTYNNPGALAFDGTGDYVAIGDMETSANTLSFWMNAGDGTSRKVLDMNGTAYVELDAGGNVVATGFPGATVYVDGTAASAVTENEWHHVAIVDATGVTASSVDIGRVSSDYFLGMLDDVRMYDRSLLEKEIQHLASGGHRILHSGATGTFSIDANLNVGGDLQFNSGTLSIGSYGIHLEGDWLNLTGGTDNFSGGTGTVHLQGKDQIVLGSNAFYNLSKIESTGGNTHETLTVEAGSTQTVTNSLTLTGTDARNRIRLQSTNAGTRYTINVATPQTVNIVDVQDSNAATSDITCDWCVNSGNNDDQEDSPHWIFRIPLAQDVSWQWYADSDGEDVTDAWPVGSLDLGEEVPITVTPAQNQSPEKADELRLRVNLRVLDAVMPVGAFAPKLQYARGPDCSAIDTWTDVGVGGGGSPWRYATSTVTDGTPLTEIKLSGTDVMARYVKTQSTLGNNTAASSGQNVEWDFHIEHNGADSAAKYCFRIVQAEDNVEIDGGYTTWAWLHTRPETEDLMRHGKSFIEGEKEGYLWADGGELEEVSEWECEDVLVDARDSQEYATVQIGDQCWMAENMNIGTRIDGLGDMLDNETIEKYCYNDDEANCDTYGGLYQWDETMQYDGSCNGTGEPPDDACAEPVQGICPDGWHIPSHYEWTTLERAVCDSETCETDFPYDASTTGERGTNEGTRLKEHGASGLEALLAGYRYTDGSFSSVGSNATFWSSLESGSDAWGRSLSSSAEGVLRDTDDKQHGYSVRCVKN